MKISKQEPVESPSAAPFTSFLGGNDEKCCKIVTDYKLRNGMKCLQNREPRKS